MKASIFVFLALAMVVAAAAASPVLRKSVSPARQPTISRRTYANSERLAELSTLVKTVKNAFGSSDRFWYRRETATGHEFVIVDAATGAKHPAFDQTRIAQAVANVALVPITPDDLEVIAISGDAGSESLTLTVKDASYRCAGTTCEALHPKPTSGEYAVSPDGRLGIVSRAGNLWLRDMESGAERQLTLDGEGADFGYGIVLGGQAIARAKYAQKGIHLPTGGFAWSADSKTVPATRIDQRHVGTYPFVETVPGDGSFRPILHLDRIALIGESDATMDYFAIDAATGTSRRIEFPDGLKPNELAEEQWGPDGRRYVLTTADYLATAALVEIAPGTQTVRVVLKEHLTPRADLNTSYYNPPNVYLTKDARELIWFSQRDGWGHLYLYDVATGKLENQITKGAWLVRDIVHVDEARRVIYFTASGREAGNPYYRYLYRIGFDGSDLTLLTPERADHLVVGGGFHFYPFENAYRYQVVSPSGKYVAYTYSTPSHEPEAVIRTTADGRLIARVEKADASALFAAGYRPPEEFTVKAADAKTDLWGVIYKPDHFDPTKRYPVIDSEYASPLAATTPRDFISAIVGPPAQLDPPSLAALGFVVVGIDARGTPGRSKAFLDYSYGGQRWATMGLEDHVAALKELSRRLGYLDLTRVGIVGWSFGGEAAIRGMLEFPDFYKVAVAACPAGGQHNMYTGTEPWVGAPVYADGSSHPSKPGDEPSNFALFDSAKDADRLRGDLLVMVAELDENVFAASTLQFTDALMKANKNFDLVFSPNAAHYVTYANFPTYPLYLRRRARDYFIQHLLGARLPSQPGTNFR
jgi:dipeptidyl aminopeptidase/acylaminoacyl peptidase